jgi:hypothetical protein
MHYHPADPPIQRVYNITVYKINQHMLSPKTFKMDYESHLEINMTFRSNDIIRERIAPNDVI